MAKMVTYDSILNGQRVTFQAPENASNEELDRLASEALASRRASAEKTRKDILQKELDAARQKAAAGDPRAAGDIESLTRELGGEVAPSAPAAAPSEMRQAASGMLGTAAKETGLTEEQLIGALLGGGGAMAEKFGIGPASIAERAVSGGMSAAAPQVPAAPTGPLSMPADQQTRILQGTTDAGATGRARMQGFNIETAQAAARAKQAEDMIAALQQRGAVGATAPQVLAQAPGMTSSPSGVVYPRNITPPPMPIAAPPKPTPLDEATQMLRNMAEKGTQAAKFIGGAARAMPIVSYPLAGYSIGSDIGAMREQAAQPEPDYIDMLLRGMGAVGTGLSLHPVTAPVGVPMAVASPLALAARRNIMAQPKDPKISYEEMVEATRPSFRYAAPGRRRRVE